MIDGGNGDGMGDLGEKEALRQSTSDRWRPPSFEGQRHTRIGASIIEQFVIGHGPGDVLRELVQNEFDGGGTRLLLSFGPDSLDVVGNGSGISADGWKRLSVIIGTGRVVGEGVADHVAPKLNGIGSKNFGLRSLFVFGDQIFVRSKGRVCLLDLQTLETGEIQDGSWRGEQGVRLHIPFRQRKFEMLEAFTPEAEEKAFQTMASDMLATLVKLALPGNKPGIRELSLHSQRTNRSLSWKQASIKLRPKSKGYTVTARKGRLTDKHGDLVERKSFEELEFAQKVEIPRQFSDRLCPLYFKEGLDGIRIAVSFSLNNRKLDPDCTGYFYYPLQASDARTGCALSVCAPFELDNDRSNLLGNSWNEWLMDKAAKFTVELLRADWFDRFGALAYRALDPGGRAEKSRFMQELQRLLKNEECWPTAGQNSEKFAQATQLVIPADTELFGFLGNRRHLHPSIAKDAIVQKMALSSGATNFTVASLIRLRTGGASVAGLKQKLKPGESDYHFNDYEASLKDPKRQSSMAAALTALSRQISAAGKDDLRDTVSTINANLQLKRASSLVVVPRDIWDVCPEPIENRLHPTLNEFRLITSLCKQFDEETWIVEACERARMGTIEKDERNAIFQRLFSEGKELSRKALQELRTAPIAKNRRGEWTRPDDMVVPYGYHLGRQSSLVNLPSKEMMAAPDVLEMLRIRDQLMGRDLVTAAKIVSGAPNLAPRLEQFLSENSSILSAAIIEELSDLPFLITKSGSLATPNSLHIDTDLNALCVGSELVVGGGRDALYRKLRVREKPAADTIFSYIEACRDVSEPIPRPELLYAALVESLVKEKRAKSEYSDKEILWLNGKYQKPYEVLVGANHGRFFDGAVPVFRGSADLGRIFVALGAKLQPEDAHWEAAIVAACEYAKSGAKARLLEIYGVRGASGLPEQLAELKCLLASNGDIYSLEELRRAEFVENDYPALARELIAKASTIGTVDLDDRNRGFFISLGIRQLSLIAGQGVTILGREAPEPKWFKAHHNDHIARMLHRPLFTKALRAIGLQQRHGLTAIVPSAAEIQRRLEGIVGVRFFDEILREYSVGGGVYRVAVEAAIQKELIGLVRPKTRLDYEQLLAQILAEVAGAASVGHARMLSTAFFPLVLCRSSEEMEVYLERIGVVPEDGSFVADYFDDDGDTGALGEELVRQVVDALEISSNFTDESGSQSRPERDSERRAAPTVRRSASDPLPVIDNVKLTVAVKSDLVLNDRSRGSASSGENAWRPRTSSEVERDSELGARGEELIYLMELERVRGTGHPDPESVVIWASRFNPGADHDIQSIDTKGRVKWLEVKSTTGVDGRFEWSRKEFEKALREREKYELWRVYKAASLEPVAKCFPNPAKMLAGAKLQIELGSFRASVENLAE